MRNETVERFLEDLASDTVTPGAGACAALHTAHAAALVAMVARRSGGGPGPQRELADRVLSDADGLRGVALALVAEEERAAGAVARAGALPAGTDAEHAERSDVLAAALADAGRVSARVIDTTDRVLVDAEVLRPVGRRRDATELAAAAEALRAAAGTARVQVETHLGGIVEPAVREELLGAVDPVDDLVLRAAKVTAAIREQILR